jgi:hypothetical protein
MPMYGFPRSLHVVRRRRRRRMDIAFHHCQVPNLENFIELLSCSGPRITQLRSMILVCCMGIYNLARLVADTVW